MLNQTLYECLLSMFGDVTVVNEGQQADITPDPRRVGRWDIAKESDHGEQYAVDCPFCGDDKKHLYISYLSFAVPVIDGVKMQMGKLRAQCFRHGCLRNKDNRDTLRRRIGLKMAAMSPDGNSWTSISKGVDTSEPDNKLNVSSDLTVEGIQTWLPDYKPISEDTPEEILLYLDSRRITWDDVQWLYMGWGPVLSPVSKHYLNDGHPWIIFPIINNGKLVGVQARCLPKYLKEDGIKYWTHPGCRKRTVLFNLDNARDTGVAVVCEGVFDVASVGKPGVCLFGHTPSKVQMTMLSTFRQGIIWLPDTDLDCIKEAKVYADRLKLSGAFPLGAHVVKLPAKDAGEMTRADIWKEILTQVSQPMAEYLYNDVIPQLGDSFESPRENPGASSE